MLVDYEGEVPPYSLSTTDVRVVNTT